LAGQAESANYPTALHNSPLLLPAIPRLTRRSSVNATQLISSPSIAPSFLWNIEDYPLLLPSLTSGFRRRALNNKKIHSDHSIGTFLDLSCMENS
ncbi:hypothetical protein RvY_17168, partial [Ramazzottius varieornatus]